MTWPRLAVLLVVDVDPADLSPLPDLRPGALAAAGLALVEDVRLVGGNYGDVIEARLVPASSRQNGEAGCPI